jgi:Tfp pilus assembly protein PilN
MRDPGLDFQPRTPGLLTVVLLLAGLLLCADAWLEAGKLHDQLDEAEGKLAQAKRRADRIELGRRETRPENVFSADESKALRQAIGAIRIDWEKLYRSIDEATSEDVSLLAIRPNAQGKSVQISGEARDMKAALAFVDALRREPLANAALLSHQIKQNDPQRPIIFEISATWLTGS